MVNKKILSAFLIVVFLTSSIYFMMPDKVRVDIGKTNTLYSVWENESWVLAATEYVNLYDGTTKMRAKSRDIKYWNDTDFAYAIRTSTWKDNITTIQTYIFDKDTDDVENMPLNNTVQCINCEGKILHYEIRDILYGGLTKEIDSPFFFGHNMKVEWQEGAYYAKVFQQSIASDKIIIKYKPNKSNQLFSVRLVDPILPPSNVGTGSTVDLRDDMTWNHDITCGENMVLIIGIAIDSEPTATVNSITYNGISLDLVARDSSADNEEQGEMWNLTDPDCGTSLPVLVTFNNPTAEESAGISAVYYGIDYINLNSINTAISSGSTSSSLAVASQSIHNRVVNVFALDVDPGANILISGDNAIQRGFSDGGVDTIALGDGYSTGGTVTIGWSNFNDEWVQIGVELISAPSVEWNQSTLEIGESINNITSLIEIDTIYGNTNVKIDCIGDCTEITTNWTMQNTDSSSSYPVLITCSNLTEGIFSATFNVTSDEDIGSDLLIVDCEIFSYGYLDVSIFNPDDNSNWYQGDTNLTINATVTCEGGSNARCGTVETRARYGTTTADTIISITEGALPFYIEEAEGWNLSTIVYDNVNIEIQGSTPRSIVFKPDGTRLYDQSGSRIYQYDCSDPWNLSSCTYDNINILSRDSSPKEMFFKPDGTILYETGSSSDLIYQSDCSDPWNLSSCTYNNINIPTQDAINDGIVFKPDGTRLYQAGGVDDLIFQHTCSDPWNLSSCIFDAISIPSQAGAPYGIVFKPDGTKLYQGSVSLLYQYDCSDPWNLSSCTYNGINYPYLTSLMYAFHFKPDGSKLYEASYSTNLIYQSSLTKGVANIQTSMTVLNKGDSWNVSWSLIVTSSLDETYKLDAFFNSSYGNLLVTDNDTEDRIVNLNPSGVDVISPTYSNVQINNTDIGQSTLFSIQFNDNSALHPNGQYIFSTNNTGVWINESAINFTTTPNWANVTKVLNSTVGTVVGYRWYADDNAGNINNTEIFIVTTTSIDSCTCIDSQNWEVDMSDSCTLSSPCNPLNVTFINTGIFTCNALLNASSIAGLSSGQRGFVGALCRINVY